MKRKKSAEQTVILHKSVAYPVISRLNWRILGQYVHDTYGSIFPPIKGVDSYPEWRKKQLELAKLLIWLENNVLQYDILIKSDPKTIHVLTRISVSMLNKIEFKNWIIAHHAWASMIESIEEAKKEANQRFKFLNELPF